MSASSLKAAIGEVGVVYVRYAERGVFVSPRPLSAASSHVPRPAPNPGQKLHPAPPAHSMLSSYSSLPSSTSGARYHSVTTEGVMGATWGAKYLRVKAAGQPQQDCVRGPCMRLVCTLRASSSWAACKGAAGTANLYAVLAAVVYFPFVRHVITGRG